MNARPRPARRATPAGERLRIVQAARARFLGRGFATTTMDDLARGLRMSKKTLYRHFKGKEALANAIVSAKIAAITRGLDAIMADESTGFAARARRVIDHVLTELSGVSPVFLQDLQRLAPRVHRRIEAVRRRVMPGVWRRLIEEGRTAGLVRDDIDPAFAAGVMLHAIQGILDPGTLVPLRLSPRQAYARSTDLLLGGILTAAGRRDHERTRHE